MTQTAAIVVSGETALAHAIELEETKEAARAYVDAAMPANTKIAYEGDFKRFRAWCDRHGKSPLPATAESVGLYLTHLAQEGRKISTIERALASISVVHRMSRHRLDRKDPEISVTLTGIKHSIGSAVTKKTAVTDVMLRPILLTIEGSPLRVLRDRAILLLGWFLASRRSELVAVDVADVVDAPGHGIELTIRRSKTDQEGQGRTVGIPFARAVDMCPVRALKAYLAASGLTEGAIFRDVRGNVPRGRMTAKALVRVIKQGAARAGFSEGDFAGHSLRRGSITTMARKGRGLDQIMRHTGQKTDRIVRGYIEEGDRFSQNAMDGIF